MSSFIEALKSLPIDALGLIYQAMGVKNLIHFKRSSKITYELVSPHFIGIALAHQSYSLPNKQLISQAFRFLYPLEENQLLASDSKEIGRGFFSQTNEVWQIDTALRACHSVKLVNALAEHITLFMIINPKSECEINLWNNSKSTDILARMTVLRELYFSYYDFSLTANPMPLENFGFLHKITSLTNLHLCLHSIHVQGDVDFSFLSNMQALSCLTLEHDSQISINHLLSNSFYLTKLTNLKIINNCTDDYKITSDLLRNLPASLESFHTQWIGFEEITLKTLRGFSSLTTLHLFGANISGNHFAPTLRKLKKLNSLALKCFFLEKATPFIQAIKSLTTITELTIIADHPANGNYISSEKEFKESLPACKVSCYYFRQEWSEEEIRNKIQWLKNQAAEEAKNS